MTLDELSDNLKDTGQGYFSSSEVIENISYTQNGHHLIQKSEDSSFWFDHRAQCILKCLKAYNIKDILDLGGGNGYLSVFFQNNGVAPFLLEPGIDGVQIAVKQGVKNVIHGTTSSIAIKNNSVSNLGLFDVLEHIQDHEDLLKDLYQCLKPGGKLLITVPTYQFLFSEFDKDVGHFRRYRKSQLIQLLKNKGFKIVYASYLFSFLVLPVFILRKFYPYIRSAEAKRNYGHAKKNSLVGKLLKPLLRLEVLSIGNISIPFGTSCLIVARKPQ
jgi:SAM-dependent methyltransferase